jgi:hypothetical protein
MMLFVLNACERTITVVETEEGFEALSCFECHSDENTFLVAAEQQWSNSVHASGLNIDRGASAGCAGCHASEGFVQRVKGETVTGHDNPTAIHCFTCHAPHSTGDFGLRWTAVPALQNGAMFDLSAGNLCVACHQSRRNVDTYITDPESITSSHWGPHHSVQGDMLIGSNGYEYSAYNYDYTFHRGATRDGCVDCHKNNATQNSVVGGHSFNMRALLRDLGGNAEEVVNVGACEGCHGKVDDFNVGVAAYAVQDSIDALIEHLHTLLETAGIVDVDGHPIGSSNTPNVVSGDQAGALWNFLMAEEDRSRGIHNPEYIRGLLESAIMFMEGTLYTTPPLAVTGPEGGASGSR